MSTSQVLAELLSGVVMRRWGVWLLILGIGSFILPLVGMQFILLDIFGQARPFVAAAMIVAGGIMLARSAKT
jgi:hypothetical protein